jgi:RHS repeat-associated protein
VNDTVNYVLGDQLGSTSVVTDASGTAVGTQGYYPFGETRYSTNTIITDRLFTGQQQLAGLGLYNYKARMYDPLLGRFLSADTITPGGAEGLNRYAYSNNNPTNYTDPSGHMATPGCSDDGKAGCAFTQYKADLEEQKLAKLQAEVQKGLCDTGKNIYCSPIDKLSTSLASIDQGITSGMENELNKPQYAPILANQYTPVVTSAVSVLAQDSMYIEAVLIPPETPIYPIAIGTSYLVSRFFGVASLISTDYQYDHSLYGTTDADARISSFTTIVSSWPKPDMAVVNTAGFMYTFLRTFGVIQSP